MQAEQQPSRLAVLTSRDPTSYEVPVTLLYLCLAMMWLEVVLGFCVGCKIHSLLVWLKWIEEPCYACNNIDWDAIRAKNASKTS